MKASMKAAAQVAREYNIPHDDWVTLCIGISRIIDQHQLPAVKELVYAAQLQVQNFERQNLYPDINHLGDDDHEAWTALVSALKAFQASKASTGGE